MELPTLDILVLLGYLALMAGMGFWFSRKNVSTEDYFVGGRSFAGWVIGLSMVGTSISSVTFLAYPADAYKTAWLRFLPNLMMPLAVLIAAYVFLPFFRRGKITSAYEYLEGRFGPSIRVYAAVAFIVAQLFRVSIVLFLVSLVVHELTGLASTPCILVSGLLVALYTVVGGFRAVIWTDVIQTIVLMAGGVICVVMIAQMLPGGLGQIFSVGLAEGKFAIAELVGGNLEPVSWELSLSSKTATMMLFLGLTVWLTEYSSNQNVVQRYCAAKSTREARKAMFVCVSVSLPVWAFFMFLGTSLYVFYQQFPAVEAAEMLDGARKAEQILPYFIINELPPGVTGLLISAALAAAMSSLDSSINAISTVSIVDIYRRHLVPGRNDKHYLRVAWLISGLAAVAMIGGAIILAESETKTLQDTGSILISLLGGGLLGLYLLGFLTRRGDARAVGMGIVCTMAFTAWTLLSTHELLPAFLHFPFDLYYTGFIGNLVMFVVGFLAGTWLPKRERNLEHLTVWD
ncbi:sodium/solute symporter [Marinihelvus fidelis]|uniref:Sodium/solute symporter n=1 Tax=Marinihelvus fidelis TaxID=2613842 RepID=A0A5N0T7Q4_9GAMM|nr:sodium:solute symporter [Marinihelvus fidelis]KAA9131033.1 sodium/solute symporter [Marinihelvus fidelis]